jgi:putative Holliday junction resolvase
MRIAALDVGEKTIGVAISDETASVALPFGTIRRTESEKKDLAEVANLVAEHGVSKVVVGLPVMLRGEESVQARKVRAFAEKLARRIKVPVVFWDERLTTVEATKTLADSGFRKKHRKDVVDAVAASLVLQGYLESSRKEAFGE